MRLLRLLHSLIRLIGYGYATSFWCFVQRQRSEHLKTTWILRGKKRRTMLYGLFAHLRVQPQTEEMAMGRRVPVYLLFVLARSLHRRKADLRWNIYGT